MPITAITIENFKGIREPVRVELKPITLLFGPNSAGKSTIIQALHYAREIFERQNLNPDRTILGGDSIDLGGFKRLIYKQDLSLPIKIRFDLNIEEEDLPIYIPPYREHWQNHTDEGQKLQALEIHKIQTEGISLAFGRIKSAWVQVDVKWSEIQEKPYVRQYEVGLNGEILGRINATSDFKKIYISEFNDSNLALWDEDYHEDVKMNAGAGWRFEDDNYDPNIYLDNQRSAIPNWGQPLHFWRNHFDNINPSFLSLLEPQYTIFQSVLVGAGELVRNELVKLCYLGPLRDVPNRGQRQTTSPDESRWANGLAAYDTIFYAEDALINRVNEWLTRKNRLNSGYKLVVKKFRELENDNPLILAALQGRMLDEDLDLRDILFKLPIKRRLLIHDELKRIELELQDIGVGISQVLPVVVAALHHKSGLVAIEQPELHIHPALQVALGDLFIEQICEYPDLTFILETHSEHLMLRFLRRIRETGEQEAPENRSLTPAELSVNFLEQGEAGISLLPIRVDEDGEFMDKWPKGFFEEREDELIY
jgi:AAA ATPase domain/AAA domain, putative AbiEii toxin, Type IV TA system/Protein of unknown function (DUF3696)